MPIDWQTSSFNHQLVCQVLNMKKNPDNIKTNDEDIYKSDSEDDEINVGDSPLCHEDETLYDGDMKNETPIFTAEQVISEIEEMMEVLIFTHDFLATFMIIMQLIIRNMKLLINFHLCVIYFLIHILSSI